MLHAVSMEVTEKYALSHRAVQEVSGEEVMNLCGGGGAGSHLQGIQRLWAPLGDGDLLPIPGESDLGGRRRKVVRNLSQARSVWKRMNRIPSREGLEPWVSGFFFEAMVQAVLLFDLETWVVTPRMGRALGGFQDHVARRLMGWILWRKTDRN